MDRPQATNYDQQTTEHKYSEYTETGVTLYHSSLQGDSKQRGCRVQHVQSAESVLVSLIKTGINCETLSWADTSIT